MRDFLKQCEGCKHPHLRPNQEVLVKPGGQLLFAMAGHKGPVKSLDLKQNGKVAVTCKYKERGCSNNSEFEGRCH